MRSSEMIRKTKETDIKVSLNLDGQGKSEIDTGLGFLDHMLELLAYHAKFDLCVKCSGDIKVDGHHSAEDIGITLGKLINELLGDKRGIARYACAYVPMDESLARSVVDMSGRPYLVFNAQMDGKIGDFDCELIEEFFRALSTYGLMTVHIDLLRGNNSHHKAEAIFKSFARALAQAVKINSNEIPSSKGVLE